MHLKFTAASFLSLLSVLSQTIQISVSETAYEKQDWAYQVHSYLQNLNHTQYIWPVKNASKKVEIGMEVYLNQLLSLDGSSQTLKASVFLKVAWYDERIVWDPSTFGGVAHMEMSTNDIWYPKVYVYNGVGLSQTIKPDGRVTLRSESSTLSYATFSVKRDFEVSCTMDLTKFPNDKHTCEMQFTAADDMRPNQTVLVAMPNAQMINYSSLYLTSNEWKLISDKQGAQVIRRKIMLALDPFDVHLYVVTVVFQRIYDYFVYTLLVPVILLTLLQVLVFVVPIESGEKLSLGITILLSFVIFLLILDNIIPKTETMPLIAHYITSSICLSAVTLIFSGFHMILYYTDKDKPMPKITKAFLIGFIARIMCMYPKKLNHDHNHHGHENKVDIVVGSDPGKLNEDVESVESQSK